MSVCRTLDASLSSSGTGKGSEVLRQAVTIQTSAYHSRPAGHAADVLVRRMFYGGVHEVRKCLAPQAVMYRARHVLTNHNFGCWLQPDVQSPPRNLHNHDCSHRVLS
jgi:hypothetical protein